MTSQLPGPSPNSMGRWVILCLLMFFFVAFTIWWINAPSSQLFNILAIIGTNLGLMIGIFQLPYFQTPLESLLHRLEAFLNKHVQINWRKAIAAICSLTAILIALLLFLGFLPTLPGLNAKLTLPPSGWRETYQDPLNTASKLQSTWDLGDSGCQLQEQSLVLTFASPSFCESRTVFLSGNFYLRITLQISTGNEAGVIVDTTQKSCLAGPRVVFFYASITTDGHYKLMYYGCKGETRILEQGSSSAIQQGKNAVNYLGILRIGSKLSIFANDQSLTSVSSNETQQLKTGRIGLAVTDYFKEKDFTVALFRDVSIYEPESSL